ERFAAACAQQPTDRRCIWLMRQAGRYMPEYRAVRARHTLLEICRRPALAAEVAITAAERLGTDCAIIFADLLLPAEPLGLQLRFTPGEGPCLEPALRTEAQITALPESWKGALGYVSESIALVHRHFAQRIAVLGFAGAPFTLASYLIEGGASKTYAHTKALMHERPQLWSQLMRKLTTGLAEFAAEQVRAGAAAIQWFDSWAGALSETDYRRYVLPHNQALVKATQALGVPAIYFSTGTSAYLETVAETGAHVLSLDWRMDLAHAWRRLQRYMDQRGGAIPVLQGNLDPVLLLGDRATLEREASRMLGEAEGRNGYIVNLGHGILPETPVENVQALVELAHGRNPDQLKGRHK
ncbi:MAG: uroporphyrinogen decarboxylase, partial [Terriglobales bacterium]